MGKRLRLATVVLSASLCARGAPVQAADSLTAGKLYSICFLMPQQQGDDADTLCNTYLHGLTDGIFTMQMLARSGEATCMPPNMALDVSEARRIFKQRLDAHPEDRNHSAGLVASMSIVRNFKCGR